MMLYKNKEKERNKKKRNFWKVKPITKVVPNKKKNKEVFIDIYPEL